MSAAREQVFLAESKYVFQLSLRVVHWAIFFAIVALSFTGYWIGSGDLPAGPGGTFQMGWIRYVHLVAGWVLLAALLLRLYLMFGGNPYASWREFVPTRREHWKMIKEIFQYYTFWRAEYPHRDFSHNRLAAATYLVVYALILFMVVSGLALHGMAFSSGWQSWLTWPLALFSAQTLRLLHHLGMWLIWGFATHHMASAILVDHELKGGLLGGIFSGWKSVPRQVKP